MNTKVKTQAIAIALFSLLGQGCDTDSPELQADDTPSVVEDLNDASMFVEDEDSPESEYTEDDAEPDMEEHLDIKAFALETDLNSDLNKTDSESSEAEFRTVLVSDGLQSRASASGFRRECKKDFYVGPRAGLWNKDRAKLFARIFWRNWIGSVKLNESWRSWGDAADKHYRCHRKRPWHRWKCQAVARPCRFVRN